MKLVLSARSLGLAGAVALTLCGNPGAGLAQAEPDKAGSAAPTPMPAPPVERAPAAEAPTVLEPGPEPVGPGPSGLLPQNLSTWSMFRNADVVVKAVLVSLAFASFVTWTIWLAKTVQLMGARRRAAGVLRLLVRAPGLADLTAARRDGVAWRGPIANLIEAAEQERDRSISLPSDGIKERTAMALSRLEAREARLMTQGTGIVATIGSTAPFVGLFGTVWGIMNSFVGISQAHTTNLAVVAPGIAEALLATAVGLVAAIPAVIIYNVFARSIAGYRALLADASAEILRHLSRDLDRGLIRPE